jgi:UPF0755 protein
MARRRHASGWRWLSSLVLLATLLALGWLAWYVISPMRVAGAVYPLSFTVEKGHSLKRASEDMAAAGALTEPGLFVLLARLKGQAGAIKAGNYALDRPASPLELLRKLTLGDTVLGRLTVIEGWRFMDMRRAIDAHPDLRHDTAGMSDSELLRAIGAEETHPEGLFFPDTYFFDAGSSDLALYRRAYQSLRQHLAASWQARAGDLPYRNAYEALIMASIIEKETGAPDERPLIASVFVNRLRIGMRLQTDPTVIYGLGDRFDGNLRRVDLQTDTPYNTYTRAGLPPTPIALAGLDSIQAAVNPARTRLFYFVSKGQGRHEFSENLDAHNRAVWRYQRGGR